MDQKQDTDLGSSTEDGSSTENTSFTRNKLLKAAGAAGAGIAFGAVTGSARAWTPSSRNAHLSKNRLERGMVGGPTGLRRRPAVPVRAEHGRRPGNRRPEEDHEQREEAAHI